MEPQSLCSALESILFAADQPVSIKRFEDVFGEEGPKANEIEEALQAVKQRYEGEEFGFELRHAHSGYHFTTKKVNVDYVRIFLATKPFKLSRSAQEVMAITAYRQPITRAEIDQVRGIDSSHILRVLIERGLVKMAGKAEVPGRPVQYGTTDKFLEVVGLTSINDLPPLSELEQLQGHTEDRRDPLEEGLDRFVQEAHSVESVEGEDVSELAAINDIIQDASDTGKEVFASRAHADVARENREALEASKWLKKASQKIVHFDDLNDSPAPDLEEEQESEPDLVPESAEHSADVSPDEVVGNA